MNMQISIYVNIIDMICLMLLFLIVDLQKHLIHRNPPAPERTSSIFLGTHGDPTRTSWEPFIL